MYIHPCVYIHTRPLLSERVRSREARVWGLGIHTHTHNIYTYIERERERERERLTSLLSERVRRREDSWG